MTKDTGYDSLREKLDSLKKNISSSYTKEINTSYRRLKNAKRSKGNLTDVEKASLPKTDSRGFKSSELDKYETRKMADYQIGENLGEFNDYLLKGDFKDADRRLNEIEDFILRWGIDYKKNHTQEEKKKLVEGINKRIERGIKYLKKNPDDKNIDYMEKILSKYKNIEDILTEKKSGLVQSLAVLSIGSVLAGIFFLSPNLTGNVIGNMTRNSGNILGGILFILGIVGAFFTLRK